jgi:hypothetical protein
MVVGRRPADLYGHDTHGSGAQPGSD